MDNDRLTGPGPGGAGGCDAALLDHWLAGRTRVDARSRRGLPRSLRPQSLSPIIKPLPAGRFRVHESNAEMRWEVMRGQGYVVPNADFFVRNHTSTPLIDAGTWRLSVFGTGLRGSVPPRRPVRFSYQDLLDLPARTVVCAIECAGNGRSFFAAQQGHAVPGTPWRLGAIGVAAWRGVPLSIVLERAGITREAVDVMPSGRDPALVMTGVSYGRVRRPIPVAKALDDVILAYEMNGEPLPPDHGFPVRVIVPHWAGIASVKWVGQIEVSATPLVSYWNTQAYRLFGAGLPVRRGVHRHPADQECLRTRMERAAAREPGVPAHRAVLVGQRAHRPHRDQHRRRAALVPGDPSRPRHPGGLAAVGVPLAHARSRVIHAAGQSHRRNRRHPARDRHPQHLRIPLRRHSRASRQHGLTAGYAALVQPGHGDRLGGR